MNCREKGNSFSLPLKLNQLRDLHHIEEEETQVSLHLSCKSTEVFPVEGNDVQMPIFTPLPCEEDR